jgi:hypothetical protein
MEHAGEQKPLHHGSSDKPLDNGVAADDASAESVQSSGRSAVILLGALAVHSILEMMALGLSDTFGDCALLTLSIALHQVGYVYILFAVCFCDLFISYVCGTSTSLALACRIDRFARGLFEVRHAKESNNSVSVSF